MAKKITPRKTRDEHAEDALYREVWEEVYAQKAYDFVRRHIRLLTAGAIAIVLIAAGAVAIRHIRRGNALEIANNYESALNMQPALAREALTRLAKKAGGGMGDLAMFRAYQMALSAGDRADATAKLEKLAADGATRDFRDLALLRLAEMGGDSMTGDEFQKMLAPVLTKRSPFYFTGLLFVAQKYLAENKPDDARPFLRKITGDPSAPASISGAAEMLAR